MAKQNDPETIRRVRMMYHAGSSHQEIANAIDASRGTVWRILRNTSKEAQKEDPVDEPIREEEGDELRTRITSTTGPKTLEEMAVLFDVDTRLFIAEGYRTNRWENFYKDDEGGHTIVPLHQTRVIWRRVVGKAIEQRLIEWHREHAKPVAKRPVPELPEGEEVLVTWGMWDAHLGLYAWAPEAGRDYDVSMASRRIKNSVDDAAPQLSRYHIERIVMPIGNDFMHFDTVKRKTTFGEHDLDSDGRYGKVYVAALDCLAYMVERALDLSKRVELLYVPGNHDLTASYGLCVALAERFRNEPRVEVDLSFSQWKYVSHGGVILGFNHGRDAKYEQINTVFATTDGVRELWSDSTYREVQVGDKHQRASMLFHGEVPLNGVHLRRQPAMCNVDAYHHSRALPGEPMKSVEAQVYTTLALVSTITTWADDRIRPDQSTTPELDSADVQHRPRMR